MKADWVLKDLETEFFYPNLKKSRFLGSKMLQVFH